MSSYNRIPRDSVSFSENKYKLEYLDELKKRKETEDEVVRTETEDEIKIRLKEEELDNREKELVKKEQELKEFHDNIEQSYNELILEQQRISVEVEKLNLEMETAKRRDYYDMREFMWEQSVCMAEEMLNQSLSSKNFSINELFEGLLKKIPVAFDELEITVHPNTLEMLKSEQTKESWILSNIRWKFDYSLTLGEFIIEEESEFYDMRFSSIFEEIRKKITDKNEEIRGAEDEDFI